MSGRRERALPALVAALLMVAVAACGRKKPATPLAQLTEVTGQVELDPSSKGVWSGVAIKHWLVTGDAVRTGAGSAARLRFTNGREIALRERSLLRLGMDADSSVHVTIELGEATIEGNGDLQLDTTRGRARLSAGTRMRVQVDDEGSRYEVVVGRAVLGEGSEAMTLAAGDGLWLRVGNAQMERYRVEVGTAELEPTSPPDQLAGGDTGNDDPAAAAAAAAAAGGSKVGAPVPRPTGPVDVSLPAGESAIIHGPQTPVGIRLRLAEACQPGPALLSLEGPGAPRRKQPLGHAEARFSLPTGAYRYRIECAGAPAITGRLEVKRDGGRSRLARRAPMNLIDADGRRYTVLYQNRLPSLTLKWPGAPMATKYTLHVASGGDERQYPAERAELHLASGALADGPHSLWFSVADGSAGSGARSHSPRTAVTIRFDNAAVTAEIDRPRDGVVVAEEAVEIAGVALQGSTVAVGAAPLTIDDQGRFNGQVPRPRGDERSIAIRFQHPRGGVHYYVRRVAAGAAASTR